MGARRAPALGALFILSVVNWFLWAAFSDHLGGDALGTLPSEVGFVVTSHGGYRAVSEHDWVFSLFYSGATLLLTPPIWIAVVARTFAGAVRRARSYVRLPLLGFAIVWCLGWYWFIGGAMVHSLSDWKKLEPPRVTVPEDRRNVAR